ncbi:hypothetical protein [Trichocoleus sp. DQ-U1]|uniref:hypothetical protein n=1 Tax=Trichocoleus sp. DQ-U1 TaxID=2933926 RepID=UPI003298F9A5
MTATPGFKKIKQKISVPAFEEPISDRPPQDLRELVNLFLKYNPDFQAAKLYATLTRYVVPALGGKKPKGERASSQEKDSALLFLSTQNLSVLTTIEASLETYFELKKIKNSARYNPKSVLNALLSWAKKQDFVSVGFDPEKEIVLFRHTRVNLQDNPEATHSIKRVPGKFQQLGMPEDYVVIGQPTETAIKKARKQILKILLKKPTKRLAIALLSIPLESITPKLVLANEQLEKEIEEFVNFSKNKLKRSETTIQSQVCQFLQILNWMKSTKPLSELKLTSIIPSVRLPQSILISEFRNQENIGNALWIAKGEAEELVQQVKKQIEWTLELYFRKGTQAGANSKVNTTKALVNLCKWLYHDQTEDFARERGYRDIPFIAVIRQMGNDLTKEHNDSGDYAKYRREKKEKMIPWELLLKASHLAFVKLEQDYKYMLGKKANGELRVRKTYRGDSAIIRDFQNALILAIATAVPPNRSKVYYQMELGDNLVKGAYIASGVFRNIDDLSAEEAKNAAWWFRLAPGDGKRNTIKREGWEVPIPNLRFITGRTLYEYLEEWINNWRPLLKPKHNFLYTTENGNGRPIDSSNYGQRFFRTVRRLVGKGVNPHLTRSMIITHSYEVGMTDAQRRSLAGCQQHLLSTQENTYNEIEQLKALQPALDMTAQFANKVYQELLLDPTLQGI